MTKNRKWYMLGARKQEITKERFYEANNSYSPWYCRERERESCNLEDERGISFYALLKLYIRDG